MQKIAVIGAGAWGTALSIVLAQAGRDVMLWTREPELVDSLNTRRTNPLYLPNVTLPSGIRATGLFKDTAACDALLIVTPAQAVRATLDSLKDTIPSTTPLVLCAKGIEADTGLLMSQVVAETMPDSPLAILTGPTFASEVAAGLPAAATLAIKDKETGHALAQGLSCRTLRLYPQDDLIGAQIGGAVKNVIAIACGVVAGRKMGESARAALVTRGMAEMARLASAMGARKETLLGMCGMGDLMLTCTSLLSRNYSLGHEIGAGRNASEILATRAGITEGYHTAGALMTLARKNAVDMPIAQTVHKVLNDEISIDQAIDALLERPVPAERRETQ